jgi:hypothetical protein
MFLKSAISSNPFACFQPEYVAENGVHTPSSGLYYKHIFTIVSDDRK